MPPTAGQPQFQDESPQAVRLRSREARHEHLQGLLKDAPANEKYDIQRSIANCAEEIKQLKTALKKT